MLRLKAAQGPNLLRATSSLDSMEDETDATAARSRVCGVRREGVESDQRGEGEKRGERGGREGEGGEGGEGEEGVCAYLLTPPSTLPSSASRPTSAPPCPCCCASLANRCRPYSVPPPSGSTGQRTSSMNGTLTMPSQSALLPSPSTSNFSG